MPKVKLLIFILILFAAAELRGQSSTTTLTASIVDDGLPNQSMNCTWTMPSGDPSAQIVTPTKSFSGVTTWPVTVTTQANFTKSGSYTFRLTCTDGQLSGSADVSFNVVVNTAPRITITAPTGGSTISFNRSTTIRAVPENATTARLFVNGSKVGETMGTALSYSWRPGPQLRGQNANVSAEAAGVNGILASDSITISIR